MNRHIAWIPVLAVALLGCDSSDDVAPPLPESAELALRYGTVLVLADAGSGAGLIVGEGQGGTLVLVDSRVIQFAQSVWVVELSGTKMERAGKAKIVAENAGDDLAVLSFGRRKHGPVLTLATWVPEGGTVLYAAGYRSDLKRTAAESYPPPSLRPVTVRSLIDLTIPVDDGAQLAGPLIDSRGTVVGFATGGLIGWATGGLIGRQDVVPATSIFEIFKLLGARSIPTQPPLPDSIAEVPDVPDPTSLAAVWEGKGLATGLVVAQSSGRVGVAFSGALGSRAGARVQFAASPEESLPVETLPGFGGGSVVLVEPPEGLGLKTVEIAPWSSVSEGDVLTAVTVVQRRDWDTLEIEPDAFTFETFGALVTSEPNSVEAKVQVAGPGRRAFALDADGRLVGFLWPGNPARVQGLDEILDINMRGRILGGTFELERDPSGTCRVVATVSLSDPLGTFKRADLILASPDWVPDFGDPNAMNNFSRIGDVAATATPQAGTAKLVWEGEACGEAVFAQLILAGDRLEHVSRAHEVWTDGDLQPRSTIAIDRYSWTVGTPRTLPVDKSQLAIAAPPGPLDCIRNLPERLAPGGVYVARAGHPSRCGGVVVFDGSTGELLGCGGFRYLLGVHRSGRVLTGEGSYFRGEQPHGGTRSCGWDRAEWNDTRVAPPACEGEFAQDRPVLFSATGEPWVVCSGGLVLRDRGGRMLHPLGRQVLAVTEDPSVLLRGPKGLFIGGDQGELTPVTGLPEGGCVNCPIGVRVDDGKFLVALTMGEQDNQRNHVLLEVDDDGRARQLLSYHEGPSKYGVWRGAPVLDLERNLYQMREGVLLRFPATGARAKVVLDLTAHEGMFGHRRRMYVARHMNRQPPPSVVSDLAASSAPLYRPATLNLPTRPAKRR